MEPMASQLSSRPRKTASSVAILQPLSQPPQNSLIGIPVELRLQIYAEVTSGADPAITLQPLLRICKIIKDEVISEMAKYTTHYLGDIEDEFNKNLRIPIRISKPPEWRHIPSITLSLPLSPFVLSEYSTWIVGKSAYTRVAEQLMKLRRKKLAIELYEDITDISSHNTHRPIHSEIALLYVNLQIYHDMGRLRALETTFNWASFSKFHPIPNFFEDNKMRQQRGTLLTSQVRYGENLVSWRATGWGNTEAS